MKLTITFDNEHIVLPVRYKHLIQGWIYSNFPEDGYGKFIHDEGYQADGKRFKMFVFSDLQGEFEIHRELMIFRKKTKLEIASLSEEFIRHIYQNLMLTQAIQLKDQILHVDSLRISEVPHFFVGERDFLVATISPVTAYRMRDGKFDYFSPETHEFLEICKQNLTRKNQALFHEGEPQFEIIEVLKAKKRIIYFKNTFYIAYRTVLKIQANYRAMQLILNTGLSSKGSAGLGMFKIVNE